MTRDIPFAPDPAPATGARAQIGTRDLSRVDGGNLVVALVAAPLAWTTHLLVAYVFVAAWCAERYAGLGVAIAVLTVVCAGVAVWSGVLAFRLWRRGQRGLLSDEEPGGPGSWDARMGERGARGVFLAVVALFMAGLFAYLIVLQAVPPLLTPHCPAGTGP